MMFIQAMEICYIQDGSGVMAGAEGHFYIAARMIPYSSAE